MRSSLPAVLPVLVAAVAAGLAVWVALPRPARPLTVPRRRSSARAPDRQPAPQRRPEPSGEVRLGKSTLRAAAAAGAGTAGLLLVPGAAGLMVAGVAAGIIWWRSGSWDTAGAQRHRERVATDLPHVVDLMMAALESGAAPEGALDRVVRVVGGPVAEELRVSLAHLHLGSDPVLVWSAMAEHPELGRLGRALHRSAESGAPVSAALVRLAEELRARAQAEVEARVRAVEVKAALPLAVCLLPAFLLLGVVPLVAGSVTGGLLSP